VNASLGALKSLVVDWLPPALVRAVDRRLGSVGNHWSGDYRAWGEALAQSTGYDAEDILARVTASALRVKNGEAACERDSVVFAEPQYEWPALAGILLAAASAGGRLDVLDFGGSLGSLYFLNRRFLDHLPAASWSVVEQAGFVRTGRARFQDERLRFYESISECRRERQPDTIILSSVLPYLSEPYQLLAQIVAERFAFIIVDRTSFSAEGRDRLTVQEVSPTVYQASYPCWFLDEKRFRARMDANYDRVAEFATNDKANIPSYFKGFIFKRR
jgi:putative methyltransferase (TIGR04325 family)